jgi:hypothetical protein
MALGSVTLPNLQPLGAGRAGKPSSDHDIPLALVVHKLPGTIPGWTLATWRNGQWSDHGGERFPAGWVVCWWPLGDAREIADRVAEYVAIGDAPEPEAHTAHSWNPVRLDGAIVPGAQRCSQCLTLRVEYLADGSGSTWHYVDMHDIRNEPACPPLAREAWDPG